MGGKAITQHEIARMRELSAQGMNHGQIALALGRSREGVSRSLSDRFSQGKTCAECSGPITDINKSGICRSCATTLRNKDPEMTAKRMEGKRRALQDPLAYAKACAVARNNIRKAMANPEIRARFVERGKDRAERYFNTPENAAKLKALRPQIGQRIRETKLRKVPAAYRELYASLMASRDWKASEALQMVLDQQKADKARAEAELSPFERQMRALERGAKLVANDTKGTLDRPANYGEARWTEGRAA